MRVVMLLLTTERQARRVREFSFIWGAWTFPKESRRQTAVTIKDNDGQRMGHTLLLELHGSNPGEGVSLYGRFDK